MSKHKKHAKLTKPVGGQYHALEFGFVGAPCSTIQSLCQQINERLGPKFSFGFIDADHTASNEMADSFDSVYTDKIDFHRIDSTFNSSYGVRSNMLMHDAVLVNGNHFKSHRQIVIINNSKKESLLRKINRLDNIQLILLDKEIEQPFDFIVRKIDGGKVVEVKSIDRIDAICEFIETEITANVAPLNGLVLMGGKSQRMGADKSRIVYHNQEQYIYLANLLNKYCQGVHLSGGDQATRSSFPVIQDSFIGLGPYSGLLSFFRENPNSAILTIPCDAPFIDDDLIEYLISHRNPQKIATCFHNPETNFPEPLITIWEPRAYPILLQFLSMGYSCPRKVLIHSDVEILQLDNPKKLFNANTPEERDMVLQAVRKQEI
jgi:molybdopterin-guanine dinucleotide biosynthesis protein A